VLGAYPDHYRSFVNEARIGSADAQSAIQPFLKAPEPASGFVNVALTVLTLVIPVPLATNGALYYVALAALIAFLWIVVGRSLKHYRSLPQRAVPPAVSRSVALLVAYLAVQALFEPDYGSALRHLTPLLPCLIVVLANRPVPTAEQRVRASPRRVTRSRQPVPMQKPAWLVTTGRGAGITPPAVGDRRPTPPPQVE